jgi:hypothetical protein
VVDVQLLASLGILTPLLNKCCLSLSLSPSHVLFSYCRVLYDKRFNAFHFPVSDEDAPNYRDIIQNPMDIATILQHVDNGNYITCAAFLQDIDLIVSNAKACILHLDFCFLLDWFIYVSVGNGDCMIIFIVLTMYNQC